MAIGRVRVVRLHELVADKSMPSWFGQFQCKNREVVDDDQLDAQHASKSETRADDHPQDRTAEAVFGLLGSRLKMTG